jgi:hypothetical protein
VWKSDTKGKTVINRIVAALVVGSFLTVTSACYLAGETGAIPAVTEDAADGSISLLKRNCRVVQRWNGDQPRLIVQTLGTILDESEAPQRRM